MIYLKNFVSFEKAAKSLSCVFPLTDTSEIQAAFEKYFWQDERSEFIEYTESGCKKTMTDMMHCFIAEQCNETKAVAKIALELKMPLGDGQISKTHLAGAWL